MKLVRHRCYLDIRQQKKIKNKMGGEIDLGFFLLLQIVIIY